MTNRVEKQRIADALAQKIKTLDISQAEAARRMDLSAATVTNILKGRWSNITGAWKQVEQFVYDELSSWQVAETANFRMIQDVCRDAQRYHLSRAISFVPGSGKTFAATHYANTNKNVFYVAGIGDMTKRQLLQALCGAMGIPASYRLGDMLQDIIQKLNTLHDPLIIIDEFDELDNKAMRVYKDLYNRCECGFILIGGRHLEERIMRGVRNLKQSFSEIYSRIGGEFMKLRPVNAKAIQRICLVNGLGDQAVIKEIVRQSQSDLRRVKALVESHLLTIQN